MYYIVLKHPETNRAMGFMVNENDVPVAFETEEDAIEKIFEHSYPYFDVIEI